MRGRGMPEPTEMMKREAVLAAAVARSKGFDIRSASDELRAQCHVIARAALPGANQLVAGAISNHNDRVMANMVHDRHEACRKAYDDGFADGKRGEYANRWGSPWPE